MHSRPAAIIFALFIAEMCVSFESAMIYAALPKLITAFGDPLMAGALVTAHMLIAAATAPVMGRLGDIKGRKVIIQILLFAALVGSVISAMANDFAWVLVGRALQGLSAAVIPLSVGVLRETLSEDKVPMGIGLLTSALGAGAALGVVLGGLIVDHFSWQTLFGASAALLGLSMLAVQAFVPAKPGTPTRNPIDWVEGLLPAPGIAAILFAINSSKEHGWLSPLVLGLLGLGLVIMLVWSRRSLKSVEPFIDLRLFRIRGFAVANGISVLLGMGTMQIVYVFSAYMQSPGWTLVGLGVTATVAGLAKLPSNVCSLFAGPLSGWMTLKLGDRATVMIGALMAASGWLIALLLPSTVVQVILLLIVISFGTTILQAAIPNVVVGAVPPERTSEAIGSMSVVRGIATALGAQVIA
ncbi:MAG TPA: MFS transporter, partial [Novosphingobium sp.]|nr:MFS transporter [Novosphingobium sp.]